MFFKTVGFRVLLPLLLSGTVAAVGTLITTLPGFNGSLPFTLETGYVGVGEKKDAQLFYYFVESQRSPDHDPLILWFSGGPGCSSFSAFFYENGPLYLEFEGDIDGLPKLSLNKNSWTQLANILYVDVPVGSGFSYSKTQEGYYVDDSKHAKQTYEFLRKWLNSHPKYLENNLYIGGDSYSGIPVPMVVQEIVRGKEIGRQHYLNLKGYILENPGTDGYQDENSRIPFAHRLSLISDELYQSTKANCKGSYVNIDSTNIECRSNIETINQLLQDINFANILDPHCKDARWINAVSGPSEPKWHQRSILEQPKPYFCREYLYGLSVEWANDEAVREALHVRMGTKGLWQRCNRSLAYKNDVLSSVPYHRNLTEASLRALIYSGDHDMIVPHVSTQEWINSLNLTLSRAWRPWFVEDQVAGYTKWFTKGNYSLTFATVKGAGHVPPMYKPKECYTMFERWLAYNPL